MSSVGGPEIPLFTLEFEPFHGAPPPDYEDDDYDPPDGPAEPEPEPEPWHDPGFADPEPAPDDPANPPPGPGAGGGCPPGSTAVLFMFTGEFRADLDLMIIAALEGSHGGTPADTRRALADLLAIACAGPPRHPSGALGWGCFPVPGAPEPHCSSAPDAWEAFCPYIDSDRFASVLAEATGEFSASIPDLFWGCL